jgi:hypothetical protein
MNDPNASVQARSEPPWRQKGTTFFQAMGLLWHECGQDFAFFCYRIGCGALTVAHSRALELAPIALTVTKTSLRKTDACSKLSYTFSARSTTLKDSKN